MIWQRVRVEQAPLLPNLAPAEASSRPRHRSAFPLRAGLGVRVRGARSRNIKDHRLWARGLQDRRCTGQACPSEELLTPALRRRVLSWPARPNAGSILYCGHERGANPPPRSDKPDQYIYDPANPAPTVGGPLCCDSGHLGPGPRDQRAVERRSDVLVYSPPPLDQDLEEQGAFQLDLFAKSSAVDTDFTAKLVDVGPDGFAQNLTEGIVRARYRNSQEKTELMNPGQIYKFTVDLWATANVFRKGHTLRLEVSSSNFPRFDKNLNTGDNAAVGGKSVPAMNTIYHDAEHPSALILPILPTT